MLQPRQALLIKMHRHLEIGLLFYHLKVFYLAVFLSMSQSKNITQLLSKFSSGDNSVLNTITPIIVDELHKLANFYMKKENAGHTLQATALVNEAFLKLINIDVEWKDRAHFFSIAAKQMRHILVDHARAKAATKRGGQFVRVNIDDALEVSSENITDLIYLDHLLQELQQFDERSARIFEMRLFSGLTNTDIAELENLSVATVEREIRVAKAWVQNELRNQ